MNTYGLTSTNRITVVATLLLLFAPAAVAQQLSPIEQLGKSIFFDKNLSLNGNQSCASCHDPLVGWTGPDSDINAGGAVYAGSFSDRFGDRKPPSAAYATEAPIFHKDKKGLFTGGNFWDGRATGEKLGNPAADQAQGPFLNPVEQALPDSACVVFRVCEADYEISFEDVMMDESCDIEWPGPDEWPDDVESVCANEGGKVGLSDLDRAKSDTAYDNIALSIAAYEASSEVNAYSSKFDLARNAFTKEESQGFALFKGKGKCKLCHPASGKYPAFTDFTFDNLGIPQNLENPAGVAQDFVDLGLGGFLENAGYDKEVYDTEQGKHKVPTLRNVDKGSDEFFVKAFGHNGFFKSLEQIVHFYNTRDAKPECDPVPATAEAAISAGCWPAPEIAENVNTDELGDLGLTEKEEAAIVAFLRTLSDGYVPEKPKTNRKVKLRRISN